jgi:hypothetical protein
LSNLSSERGVICNLANLIDVETLALAASFVLDA